MDKEAAPLLAKLKEIMDADYITRVDTPSKAQRLRDDAFSFENMARELERRAVPSSFSVSGNTADELVDAIMDKPQVLGPTIAVVHEWAEKVRKAGEKGRLTLTYRTGRLEG